MKPSIVFAVIACMTLACGTAPAETPAVIELEPDCDAGFATNYTDDEGVRVVLHNVELRNGKCRADGKPCEAFNIPEWSQTTGLEPAGPSSVSVKNGHVWYREGNRAWDFGQCYKVKKSEPVRY